jgi:hypothetical protein
MHIFYKLLKVENLASSKQNCVKQVRDRLSHAMVYKQRSHEQVIIFYMSKKDMELL